MSTLEELKKQASEVTQRKQVAAAAPDKVTDEEKWRKLAPVMKFLKDHFIELAETLNVLDKETLVDFEIKEISRNNSRVEMQLNHASKKYIFKFNNLKIISKYNI